MKSFILFTLISLTALAGPVHVGNGGNAIKISDGFYLLDLAEQGIAEEPNFKDTVSQFYYEYFRARTIAYPTRIPSTTLELFSHKLAEIAELDPVYAEALITAFENVRWTFINYRLNDIPVESIIAGPYYQIAARTNDVILMDTLYWKQMNEANRVALLVHELNYILIYPQKDSTVGGLEKSALKSRLQTGYLFSQNLQFTEPIQFSKRIQNLFPSRFANKLDQLVFFKFTFKSKNGNNRMAFNPYIMINGSIPSANITNATADFFSSTLCGEKPFELKTVEIVGKIVKQDIFNGDNNSQDVTSFMDLKIPGFVFTRLPNESCKTAADRAYGEISQALPGVFHAQ